MTQAPLALMGGGLKSQRLVRELAGTGHFVALVDPTPSGQGGAELLGLPLYGSIAEAKKNHELAGAIVATTASETLMACHAAVEAGLGLLVEPSRGTSLEGAQKLVKAAEHADVPFLVGYVRRFHPQFRLAKQLIEQGRLGQISSVQMTSWFPRPSSYFDDIHWEGLQGHGPLLYELVDDFDALTCLFGDVEDVIGLGHKHTSLQDFVDTAALVVRFTSGVVGTLNLSDRVVAPYNWSLTAGDDEAFSKTGEACLWIGGTEASLALPQGKLYYYQQGASFEARIQSDVLAPPTLSARQAQFAHFNDVLSGRVKSEVSGSDALRLWRWIEHAHHRVDS